MENNKAKLYQKMIKVMQGMEWMKKTGWNDFHKYAYVEEATVVNHCRNAMSEAGLVLYNSVKEYEINGQVATVTVEFTLADAETGESITSTIVAEGMDKGDKKFPKAFASATKYFLMKTFLIPTGDDPEADITTDQQAYQGKPGPSQNKQTGPSMNKSNKPVTPKQLGLLKGRSKELAELVGMDEDGIMETLRNQDFNFKSFEDLTQGDASKVIDQLNEWKKKVEKRNQSQANPN